MTAHDHQRRRRAVAKARIALATPHAGASAQISESFATLSAARAVLAAHRAEMERSAALVAQARTLCTRIGSPLAAATLRLVRAEPCAGEGSAPVQWRGRCTVPGCARTANLQPCFVLGYAARRAVVRDLPLQVCGTHRDDLEGLFRRPGVLEAFQRKLAGLGHEPPSGVRIFFEVVG